MLKRLVLAIGFIFALVCVVGAAEINITTGVNIDFSYPAPFVSAKAFRNGTEICNQQLVDLANIPETVYSEINEPMYKMSCVFPHPGTGSADYTLVVTDTEGKVTALSPIYVFEIPQGTPQIINIKTKAPVQINVN
jgi:hypothetical protein